METRKESLEFAAKIWGYDLSDFSLHPNLSDNDYVTENFNMEVEESEEQSGGMSLCQ